MKNIVAKAWWWRMGRSVVLRGAVFVLAVAALLPGKAIAAAPEDDGIADRIKRIRKEAKDLERGRQILLEEQFGPERPESTGTLWHNHWNNHWHKWTRWTNWHNHWNNHWHNHWHWP